MAKRALLLILLVNLSCSTVPGTGRTQLNLMTSTQEISLGAQSYKQILRGEKIIESGEDAEMVKNIGEKIAVSAQELFPTSNAKKFRWEFKLVDNQEIINAWALPGGKVAVYTGLLNITRDEDSLAIVIGHEAAHAIARHGAERMSQSLILELGLLGASISLSDLEPNERDFTIAALGVGATLGISLPFSRSHESEADYMGLLIAANAGYNPGAALGVWERMKQEGQQSPEWLSTHPYPETRITNLQSWMPEAMKLYQNTIKK